MPLREKHTESLTQEYRDLKTETCLQYLNLINNKQKHTAAVSVKYFLVLAGKGGMASCGPIWARTCLYLCCV